MEKSADKDLISEMEEDTTPPVEMHDYSELLTIYGADYTPSEYYWQVGEIGKTQGWILHLSVIKLQLLELLQIVLPELIAMKTPFKIVRDDYTADIMLQGTLGYLHVGKMISIYSLTDEDLPLVAQKLISMTKEFRGPAIPTDFHLGSILYTRYGSYNPVIMTDQQGISTKFIYNTYGALIPDPYNIPFRLTDGVLWPFSEMVSPVIPKRPKLLNSAYYPIYKVKSDAKGDVLKALYFEKFWLIRSCLIKQGRHDMFADDSGRDIHDRLQWQYQLYKDLVGDIPMPRVFDFFKECDDTYLAMQFIKGKTLFVWISSIYKDRNWLDLSLMEKLTLLDQLTNIISIVQRLHERGYVHRDINPANFLIDKKGKVYLIDMELACSYHSGRPSPPFELGTFGYMSPEQHSTFTPTVKEDIYAMGALIMVFITNLSPLKFSALSVDSMVAKISFFAGQPAIGELVTACLQFDPDIRPELETIQKTIGQYRRELNENSLGTFTDNSTGVSHNSIVEIINAGLRGLSDPILLSTKGRWMSKIQRKENFIGNEQGEMALYEGWHTGMAGPLWLVALAKRSGFVVDNCLAPYFQSWDYIKEHYFKDPSTGLPGLYSGGAGIAMAIAEGLRSRLLSSGLDWMDCLHQCFSASINDLTLSNGVAGQGIALLNCSTWLESSFFENLITGCVNRVVNEQLTDGSWGLYNSRSARDKITLGLDGGVAGVIWFLLAYLQFYPDDSNVKESIGKGLDWFIRKIKLRSYPKRAKGRRSGHTFVWSLGQGLPGIILVFIRAYELLNDQRYKEVATECLQTYPVHPVILEFNMAEGLVGLGEVCMEAYRVFNDLNSKTRVDWIEQVFGHTFQYTQAGEGWWITDSSRTTTADLFSGYGGIIHFLIRYQALDQFSVPFASKKDANHI